MAGEILKSPVFVGHVAVQARNDPEFFDALNNPDAQLISEVPPCAAQDLDALRHALRVSTDGRDKILVEFAPPRENGVKYGVVFCNKIANRENIEAARKVTGDAATVEWHAARVVEIFYAKEKDKANNTLIQGSGITLMIAGIGCFLLPEPFITKTAGAVTLVAANDAFIAGFALSAHAASTRNPDFNPSPLLEGLARPYEMWGACVGDGVKFPPSLPLPPPSPSQARPAASVSLREK